jgi:uncharacterized protein (DUF486 family)
VTTSFPATRPPPIAPPVADLAGGGLTALVRATRWLVAFFEYCLQGPANRIGYEQAGLSLAQLKVMQEIITMAVFAVFAVLYMKEKLTMNFAYATICLVAAAWFMFRDFRPAA